MAFSFSSAAPPPPPPPITTTTTTTATTTTATPANLVAHWPADFTRERQAGGGLWVVMVVVLMVVTCFAAVSTIYAAVSLASHRTENCATATTTTATDRPTNRITTSTTTALARSLRSVVRVEVVKALSTSATTPFEHYGGIKSHEVDIEG